MRPKTIVFTGGGFDPFHLGHLTLLEESAKLGDKLIVSVARTEHMIKKKGYEFMPQKDRISIIGALRCVDQAVLHKGNDGTLIENLYDLRVRYPNARIIFTKGGEYTPDNLPEAEVCSILGIEVRYNLVGTLNSSSELVKKSRNYL